MDKGGGWNIRKRGGGTSPYSLNSFIFRCLPLLFGFHNDDTEKSKKTIAPPPETGFPAVPCSGAMRHALHRPQGVAIVGIYPCGKARNTPPFPRASSCRIGPRRQGFASPLRALDGSGPIRKTRCLRGERGGADPASGLPTTESRGLFGF